MVMEPIPQPGFDASATEVPPTVMPTESSSESRPYLKRQQLLQELLKNSELLLKSQLEVRHLMSLNPITVAPTATVEEMDALMKEHRLRHLVVCGRNGEPLGLISDRDLHAQHGTTAHQLMSYPVLTVTPDTGLSPAITFLINEGISCLPVVDNGRLCGILTVSDLVLTLQCTLQLWTRLAQVLYHDAAWNREFDQIIASIESDSEIHPERVIAQIQKAREAIRSQIESVVHNVDLGVDVLTGISNRRGLEETMDMLLATRNRYGQSFTLVIVTIEHYEYICETCGEDIAKTLVKAVGKLIQRSIRGSDYVARHREDAFVVVLTQTDREGAVTFCHRLRTEAKATIDLDLPVRISTGVVTPEPGETLVKLMERANTVAPLH
jgi:diguanylate cyclase (GGDEF)-like protein